MKKAGSRLRAHVPISKIENGMVDLHLPSLVQIIRTVGLEVSLVPHKLVPAVKAIVRSSLAGKDTVKPVYSLDEDDNG